MSDDTIGEAVDLGRVPSEPGSRASTEPASSLGPSGFDPSRGGRFCIAITMTKDIPTGINICTRLNIWSAASMDEAVGKAVREAQEARPEHDIFSIAKMPVPEIPCDSDGSPKGRDAEERLGAEHDSAGLEEASPQKPIPNQYKGGGA